MKLVSSITPDWKREVPRYFWGLGRKFLNTQAGNDWSEMWLRKVSITRTGGHVDIGAGAKMIGNFSIANDVLIGANAVVVKM